jgi:hypothetical protein
MRIAFEPHGFSVESQALIAACNDILADYQARGFRMTLRQLYYQLVSRNIIPNQERAYKNLSALTTTARWAGEMDIDALEDRMRQPLLPVQFDNLQDLVKHALRAYRLPRWETQPAYVEVWCEKDALVPVLEPVARGRFHVVVMGNRGYSSTAARFEDARRFLKAMADQKACRLLYFGDHDPSGKDMVRDVEERLERCGCQVDVEAVALTREQVMQYQLPPQPAKTTDARYDAYAAEHGTDVWELDALDPSVLVGLVRDALELMRDRQAYANVLCQERRDKAALRKAVQGL